MFDLKILDLHGGSLGEAKVKESVKKTSEGTKAKGWKQQSCCSEFSGGAPEHAWNAGKEVYLREKCENFMCCNA